jgi:hypothetical protein
MLLTRFWNVLVALLLGAAVFVLYLATSMYNRAGARTMAERLSSDSQVVSWYLKEDSRERAAQLIQFAVNSELARALQKSNESEAKVPPQSAEKVHKELRSILEKIPPEFSFDAVFVVDQLGRVVDHSGYEQASGMENFELGGYSVVADALHGYIRDDTLILDRMYRVVARPVELEAGQAPVGAIMGARIVDDRFSRALSLRTNAAVGFYARGQRVASGAPDNFDKSQLDQIVGDLEELEHDDAYRDMGRSKVRNISGLIGVQYSRLPGESWSLGAGYVVARRPDVVDSPLGFFQKSDDKDKEQARVLVAILIALGAALIGILFSILEHTRPLLSLRAEAIKLAKGQVDQLHPSRFRGILRKIASDLNDGIDQVAAKGGVPRKAADLSQVLGDIPDQPQMSAFAFPGDGASSASTVANPMGSKPMVAAPQRNLPMPSSPRGVPKPAAPGADAELPGAPEAPARRAPPPRAHAQAAATADDSKQETWRAVFEDFVRIKEQCGESVEGLTYEKFEVTLKKNEGSLMKHHAATSVKFSVYVKDGKAALKASPIR